MPNKKSNSKISIIMKQLFTFVAIATMALFVACEGSKTGDSSANFKLTSSNTFEVNANGGTVAITYTISKPVDGASVSTSIVSGNNAVANISQPAVGVILVDVRANSSSEARAILIKATYVEESYDIVITQAAGSGNQGGGNQGAADVTFDALSLDGYYYGEKYGDGADRYAFFLSDQGLNNGGQAYPNGTYYYVDCFSPANKSISLPLGTYTFDSSNSGQPFTINSENSRLILTGDSVETIESKFFTNAKLVVTTNKIVLEVTIDGKVHKVTFVGDLSLEDVSDENGDNGDNGNNDPTDGQDGEAQSTLSGDRHVTFDGEHRAKWGYEGDYWGVGYSNYTIYIMNKSGGYVYGDTLQFDLIADNQSKDGKFAGKYTISNTPGKLVMVAGFTNKYAQAVGSWFYEYGGGSASGYKNYAMIKSGTAEFIDNGDGTHTVKLDGYDYKGNNITCNWTGIIEED